mgnify:CR=1 FL=1
MFSELNTRSAGLSPLVSTLEIKGQYTGGLQKKEKIISDDENKSAFLCPYALFEKSTSLLLFVQTAEGRATCVSKTLLGT